MLRTAILNAYYVYIFSQKYPVQNVYSCTKYGVESQRPRLSEPTNTQTPKIDGHGYETSRPIITMMIDFWTRVRQLPHQQTFHPENRE